MVLLLLALSSDATGPRRVYVGFASSTALGRVVEKRDTISLTYPFLLHLGLALRFFLRHLLVPPPLQRSASASLRIAATFSTLCAVAVEIVASHRRESRDGHLVGMTSGTTDSPKSSSSLSLPRRPREAGREYCRDVHAGRRPSAEAASQPWRRSPVLRVRVRVRVG